MPALLLDYFHVVSANSEIKSRKMIMSPPIGLSMGSESGPGVGWRVAKEGKKAFSLLDYRLYPSPIAEGDFRARMRG